MSIIDFLKLIPCDRYEPRYLVFNGDILLTYKPISRDYLVADYQDCTIKQINIYDENTFSLTVE